MNNDKLANIYIWAVTYGLKQITDIPKDYQKLVSKEVTSRKKAIIKQ